MFDGLRVLFKAPASFEIGLGHLSRACSLAWYMQRCGAKVAVQCETEEVFPQTFLKSFAFPTQLESYDLFVTDGDCHGNGKSFALWAHLGDSLPKECNRAANLKMDF